MAKTKRKIRLGIIFGGQSSEHEVSLQSAKSIIEALDRSKYEPVLIGIDKQGTWRLQDTAKYLLHDNNPALIKLNKSSTELVISPSHTQHITTIGNREVPSVDVVFPVLHGPLGEDGTMQGLLKLLDVPFVGPDVLGSAIGMDKDVMKRLLSEVGIPVAKFLVSTSHTSVAFSQAKRYLGLPMFIKPANAGSSVGVSRVTTDKEFKAAVSKAFLYDNKILMEQAIVGREIECAVLGNERPIASIPGEVIPQHDFYSYEAKYIDEHGAVLEIPARLPKRVTKSVQEIAIKAFTTLCLEGMARVDMFVTDNGKVIMNEVNTIPGFTKISMYPKLWEASGLSYSKLIDTLVILAIQRHNKQRKFRTSIT